MSERTKARDQGEIRAGCRRAHLRVLLPALALMTAACDSNPMGPGPLASAPCQMPSQDLVGTAMEPFAPAALQSALRHAAGPMAAALGSGQVADELVKATSQLSTGLGGRSGDTECRVLRVASEALARLPDDPGTRPDRDGIRLVLVLAARALTGAPLP